MRATALVFIALIITTTSILAAPASMAQIKSKMAAMQASNPRGFAACQALASSRGYRIAQQNDYEYMAVVSFIDGCLMGRQH